MTSLLAALALIVAAQGGAARLPTFVLPAEQGAWVIRIETSGGFAGRGAGHFTASSVGDLFCVDIDHCAPRLVPAQQRLLSTLVATVLDRWTANRASPPSRCSDCVTTTMTLRVRTSDGEREQRYEWDSSTIKAIPAEVLRLYRATAQAVGR